MPAAAPSPAQVERFRRDLDSLGVPPGRVAVAVSGGPDSLALLLLATAARSGEIAAATVDHGLRPESGAEAEHVAAICADLGCPHRILTVAVPAGGEGLQGEARRERYRALAGWMAQAGLSSLLTAHHADDQAETLLMRLLRGSGVAGLAGVRARLPLPGAEGGSLLFRPLLGWRREELATIVREAGLDAIDDPSNANEAFDRVRIRRRLAETPWLTADPLARSAAALAEADEALEETAELLFEARVEERGKALVLRPDDLPAELLRRVVLRCLRRIAPGAAPRGEQIGALIDQLRRGGTISLAGVKCIGGAEFRFEAAPPRRADSRPSGRS
jgi:tRNA(Ile)-lysidine synthase